MNCKQGDVAIIVGNNKLAARLCPMPGNCFVSFAYDKSLKMITGSSTDYKTGVTSCQANLELAGRDKFIEELRRNGA